MRIVTAPEQYSGNPFSDITCFLAGGICGCMTWQKDVIEKLKTYIDLDNLVIFNPRRDNFLIDDPSAARQQITWEFEQLERCDIFSMFFCDGESDQPICMYELGRNLLLKQVCNNYSEVNTVVITCHNDYNRKQDVEIQVDLANKKNAAKIPEPVIYFGSDYDTLIDNHARRIVVAYHMLIANLESGRIHGEEI